MLFLAGVMVLRFGAVWTGDGPILHNAAIVVEGERISEVRKDNGKYPKDARVIDLRRYSAVPGLVDAHTHITYYWDRTPGTRPRGRSRPDTEQAVRNAAENGKLTLAAGVTTVRDLGGEAAKDYRDAVRSGEMIGPRVVAAVTPISGFRGSPGVDGVRKQVAEIVAAGADVIKMFGSNGSYEVVDGTQRLTYEEMQAGVDAAHGAGKRIAIHAYGAEAFRAAVKAGPDSIEHGADVDDATLREMARKKIFFVPTVDHNRYYVDAREEFGFAPETMAPLRDYIARNLDTARRAHLAGVRFAMGSDAVYTMFGQNTRELEWFKKAGLSDEQCLRAATVNGAELLGLGTEIGKLQPRFFADIVAVEGEPWKDISRLVQGVKWVMKGGQVVVGGKP
jgi:imidazolonepropionase-like amidohydrolase